MIILTIKLLDKAIYYLNAAAEQEQVNDNSWLDLFLVTWGSKDNEQAILEPKSI